MSASESIKSDTELILLAANQPVFKKPKKKRYQLVDMFDDVSDEIEKIGVNPQARSEPDPVTKAGEQEYRRQKRKRKKIYEWTANDLAYYFKTCLKTMGISLEVGGRTVAGRIIGTIHDSLFDLFEDKINITNYVIKEYLDWWIYHYAQKHMGRSVHLSWLDSPEKIERFASHYRTQVENYDNTVLKSEDEQLRSDLTDEELYNLGLEMFLLKRGIVRAYRFLQTKHSHTESCRMISKACSSLSPSLLEGLMRKTIHESPYEGQPVDFISMAQECLSQQGLLDKYKNVSIYDYFKG